MPHLIVDYSPNLEAHADFKELFQKFQNFVEQNSEFPVAATRCRARACDHFHMANGDPNYAYLHVNFRVSFGRTPRQLREAGREVRQLLLDWMEPINSKGEIVCALSFEISQIDPDLTWKYNPVRVHMAKHMYDNITIN